MKQDNHITQELLCNLFDYEDGRLRWKKTQKIAGCVRNDGRRVVGIKGKLYLSYRLIWMIHHGSLPDLIDHIDGNPSNDRIENLRPATKTQNGQNRNGPKKNAKTGFMGVYFDKCRNLYASEIIVNGQKIHLGRHKTPEEAHEAYIAAKRQFHEFNTL